MITRHLPTLADLRQALESCECPRLFDVDVRALTLTNPDLQAFVCRNVDRLPEWRSLFSSNGIALRDVRWGAGQCRIDGYRLL